MQKKPFINGILSGMSVYIMLLGFIYFQYVKPSDIDIKEIEIQDLEGNQINLNKFDSKPLVINFWATWCRPCLVEFPHFEKVKKQLGKNINFIMISEESTDEIQKFKNKHPFQFNFFRSIKNFEEYGITALTSIPTTYFFDSSGKLKTIHSSSIDLKTLKTILNELH